MRSLGRLADRRPTEWVKILLVFAVAAAVFVLAWAWGALVRVGNYLTRPKWRRT